MHDDQPGHMRAITAPGRGKAPSLHSLDPLFDGHALGRRIGRAASSTAARHLRDRVYARTR